MDDEETLWLMMRAEGIADGFERQYRFLPERKYRADFAHPQKRIIVEVDGGGWIYGRHHRPQGYEQDRERDNLAVIAGWRVLRFTPAMIRDGRAVQFIKLALERSV